jgi:hypothetical protein
MKYFLAFAILMVVTFGSSAIAQEYLAPCKSALRAYENRVDSIAHGAMAGGLEFSVTVIPSFNPEWSVGVTSDRGSFYLTYVVFDQSLWHSSWVPAGAGAMKNDASSGHAKPMVTRVRITRNLYAALRSVWAHSIASARPSEALGFDGVTYKFELPQGKCASTWAPAPKTRNGRLVSLVDALRELTSASDKTSGARQDAILKTLDGLSQPSHVASVALVQPAHASTPTWPKLTGQQFLAGHAGTGADVASGKAVFAATDGVPLHITIPQYAYFFEAGSKTPVVVVQAELSNGAKILGAVDSKGNEVIGTLPQFKLLGVQVPGSSSP